ncbi:MAG: helix-turn-helix domain-containing protein [Chloroflexi bacterium]|nr:helix-turn-helix domain-containing protein [Chloroflexota bacterium]
MASSSPEWLTTEEAARILGYHVEYVRRLAREGKLEGTRSR